MSEVVTQVGLGAVVMAQIGLLTVAVKALGRRKAEDARRAHIDASRIVCPVTMNGFKAVIENLLEEQRQHTREQREQTSVLKEIAVHLEVLREASR